MPAWRTHRERHRQGQGKTDPDDAMAPGWLAGFRATETNVQVQLDIRNSPAVLRAVLEDRVEIGFVEGTDPLNSFTQ